MGDELMSLLSGEILEDDVELTLAQLCRSCRLPAERVIMLVEEGVIEPRGREPAQWRFHGVSVQRVRCALRLEHDLGVNAAGAALVLDLLEELQAMRARLRRFE
ncbi:MAG: chaperone modulator CbpM [Pseudomonadota bacterium]